tara:strand:+ start:16607 stop:16723 length:117 start_codon:yes stop_codon:yes gene_type:complete
MSFAGFEISVLAKSILLFQRQFALDAEDNSSAGKRFTT